MTYLFSTLNLYFCRIFLSWLGVCALTLGSIVSLFEGTELIRRSMGKANVDFSIILEMVILKLPSHLLSLMPFIILSAAMVSLYRLNHSHEIIAARSSGVSIWQLLVGLCSSVLAFGILQLVVLNPVSAAMSTRLENLEAFYFSNNSSRISISETGLWLREITSDRQSIIHTTYIQPEMKTFKIITFYGFHPNGEYETRIDAGVAELQKGYWKLKDATVWQDKEGSYQTYPTLEIPTGLTMEKIQNSNTTPETISFWSLPKFIDILDRSGLSSLSYRLYWHAQIAKLGMMIAMILLATAFGIRPVRQGGTVTYIALGIGGGFILYFLNDIVYALGLSGKIPILLAAWTPTLVMSLLSVSLLLHLEDG